MFQTHSVPPVRVVGVARLKIGREPLSGHQQMTSCVSMHFMCITYYKVLSKKIQFPKRHIDNNNGGYKDSEIGKS